MLGKILKGKDKKKENKKSKCKKDNKDSMTW